jgi:glycolate oxidase FAD binding subunit
VSAVGESLARAFGAEAVTANGALGVPWVAPASIEGVCEALRLASRDRLRVLPAGRGLHLEHPPAVDFVLSSARLDRIVEYEPDDMVAVVESGVGLAALDARVAGSAQRVAPDPRPEGGATVGGAVAANRCGLTRRGRGSWRDAVLGARVVHADGRVAKTGGRVVKDVAGFDLAKLYVGSRGSLVWIAEVSLRLVSRPQAACTLVHRCERSAAAARLLALHRAALAPAALLLVEGAAIAGGSTAIVLRLEGREAVVQAQARTAGQVCDGWVEADAPAWDALSLAIEPRPGARLVRIVGRPTGAVAWLDALVDAAPQALVAQFGVGVAHAQLPAAADLGALAGRMARCGARVEFAPARLDPVARALAVQTKRALDPATVFPVHPDLGDVR